MRPLRWQNRNTDFAKLLAGEERLMVHDGGGSISLSGIARMSATTLTMAMVLCARAQWQQYCWPWCTLRG
jgi:hypothetical protein